MRALLNCTKKMVSCDHAAVSHGHSSHTPHDICGQQQGPCVMHSPYNIRFTHANISDSLRNGDLLDDAIDKLGEGNLDPAAFPPLEVAVQKNGSFSLSNRRLCFSARGALAKPRRSQCKPMHLYGARLRIPKARRRIPMVRLRIPTVRLRSPEPMRQPSILQRRCLHSLGVR